MDIKDYIPGDEIKILELFELSFKKKLSIDYWNWRFLNNPEHKLMIKLMWDKEELVGHYAVSPVQLLVAEETILTALSMTTMTHPEYAGKGIFTDLAEALYLQEQERNGLKAVWGFPNANSHYGFIKNLKWKNLEQIPTFTLECSKLKPSSFPEIRIANQFTEQHVNTQKKGATPFSIQVKKSVEYLNWRYIQNPINTYDVFEASLDGDLFYAVTKVFPSFVDKNKFEVDLLELAFPANYELLLQLLNAIKAFYKSKDVVRMNVWIPLNDPKHIQLEKIGFNNSLPITYSGIRILDSAYSQLEKNHNWNYSMGDSDVY